MTVRKSDDATAPMLPLAESLAVNDAASADDHLGFARFAVPLAEYIAGMRPSQTPWAVGVYGEWGSGKTSFLKQVSAELTTRGIDPVWFNAWKYAREQDLWKALIQTVLDRVRVSGPWPRRVWVKTRIWIRSLDVRSGLLDLSRKLLVLFLRIGLIALGIFMAASLFGPATNAVQTALERALSDYAGRGRNNNEPNRTEVTFALLDDLMTRIKADSRLRDSRMLLRLIQALAVSGPPDLPLDEPGRGQGT